MTTAPLAPIAAPEQWAAVMERAGHRCQCVTAGHPHHRTPGRCEADSGVRLIAGPRDPGPHPERTATAVPVEELQAWCVPCFDAAVSSSRRRAKRLATLRQRETKGLW